jgi:uncharacterized protein YoxC
MEKLQSGLLENTAMGIFAVILLVGLVIFATWTKGYIEEDRKNKEIRIKMLEEQVHGLQHKFNEELMSILMKHESMMLSMQDTFKRMERLWERIERKIEN